VKRELLYLFIATIAVMSILGAGEVAYSQSPISPIEADPRWLLTLTVHALTPTPEWLPTVYAQWTAEAQPTREPVMLAVQADEWAHLVQPRLWPIGDVRYDGCVMLHSGDWICQ
jgi:hypothetical protein